MVNGQIEDICFFSVKDRNLFHPVKDRNLFHRVDTIGNILGEALSKSVQFFSVIPYDVPFPHSNALQYYVKLEKFKVNDVIFPSGCEARAINLGNKNMKIGIFTGATSVKSKNISPIFLDILPESMK